MPQSTISTLLCNLTTDIVFQFKSIRIVFFGLCTESVNNKRSAFLRQYAHNIGEKFAGESLPKIRIALAQLQRWVNLAILGLREKNCRLNQIPFNGKVRGYTPGSHMYLISLKYSRFFFLWSLAVLFLIARYFLDVYQNYMAFWPLTSSYFVERNFSRE